MHSYSRKVLSLGTRRMFELGSVAICSTCRNLIEQYTLRGCWIHLGWLDRDGISIGRDRTTPQRAQCTGSTPQSDTVILLVRSFVCSHISDVLYKCARALSSDTHARLQMPVQSQCFRIFIPLLPIIKSRTRLSRHPSPCPGQPCPTDRVCS